MRTGVITTIGLLLDTDTEFGFTVSTRDPEDITLTIGDSLAEITFDPSAVETLRDKADEALRRWRELAAEDQDEEDE
jgi:hypothetical protein